MELYELLETALSDLDPMPDQLPAVHRIGRRKQRQRMAALGAAGAAFVIGVGTLVIAAPWSDRTDLAPGGPMLSTAAYSQLLTSAIQGIWPKTMLVGPSAGADSSSSSYSYVGPISAVGVRFGAGQVPVAFPYLFTPQPMPASMSMVRMSSAEAARDKPCPSIPVYAQETFFCTETTMADGTVVQVSNLTEVAFPAGAKQPEALPFQYEHVAPNGNFQQVGADGYVQVYGIEEVTVWQGDAEEQLFVPMLDSTLATLAVNGIGTRLPVLNNVHVGFKPSVADMTAIGESSQFQLLLRAALAGGLVPPVDQASTGLLCDALPAAPSPSVRPTAGPSSKAPIVCSPSTESVQPTLTWPTVHPYLPASN
jgi:hypothetical protein